MKALTDSFKQAVAEAKYIYAAYLTPIPPAKVRAVMEQQGWTFGHEAPAAQKPSEPSSLMSAYADNQNRKKEIDPNITEPAPYPYANNLMYQFPKQVIKNRQGQNIFDAGSDAIEHYEEELKKAARKVYLTPAASPKA